MIHESTYWKKELIKLAKKLTNRLIWKRSWTDAQHGTFEKEIMIGFYIIRRLKESQKLPNTIVSTKIMGRKYPNNGKFVHLMNNHSFFEFYNFTEGKDSFFDLPFLINQIIHSYIFSPYFEEDEKTKIITLSAIHFCSDDKRNEYIYELKLQDIIFLFQNIGTSDIVSASYIYDEQKKDYRVNQSGEIIIKNNK